MEKFSICGALLSEPGVCIRCLAQDRARLKELDKLYKNARRLFGSIEEKYYEWGAPFIEIVENINHKNIFTHLSADEGGQRERDTKIIGRTSAGEYTGDKPRRLSTTYFHANVWDNAIRAYEDMYEDSPD